MILGGVQFLVTERFAVRLGCALPVWSAETNDGAAHDDGRARVGFGGLDRGVNRVHTVTVVHFLDVPVIRGETRGAVFGEGQVGGTVNRDVIVVVEIDQLAET